MQSIPGNTKQELDSLFCRKMRVGSKFYLRTRNPLYNHTDTDRGISTGRSDGHGQMAIDNDYKSPCGRLISNILSLMLLLL